MNSYSVIKATTIVTLGLSLTNYMFTASLLAIAFSVLLFILLLATLLVHRHAIVAKYTEQEAKHKSTKSDKANVWSGLDYAVLTKYIAILSVLLGIFGMYYAIDVATGGEPVRRSKFILDIFGVKGFAAIWMTLSVMFFHTTLEMICYLVISKRI